MWEMDMIIILLKFWNVCFVFSLLLMALRTDAKEMFFEIFGRLFVQGILSFIFSVIMIYVLLPFTIPYSIVNIFKN
jgi:hypothetical protein